MAKADLFGVPVRGGRVKGEDDGGANMIKYIGFMYENRVMKKQRGRGDKNGLQ
jgi:hypothetical protein